MLAPQAGSAGANSELGTLQTLAGLTESARSQLVMAEPGETEGRDRRGSHGGRGGFPGATGVPGALRLCPTCQDLSSQLGGHPLRLVTPEGADVVEEPVARLLPGQPQLLGVNDAIRIQGFPHQPLGFLLVHQPDLRELLRVAGSKMPVQKREKTVAASSAP